MSEKEKQAHPYQPLGAELKQMRLRRQESLAEVSGAVEIEADMLSQIELGKQRPSEDILLLLISYFAAKEDAATRLWELAGYDQRQLPAAHMINDEQGNVQQSVFVMPMDARVLYTDMVHVMVNNYGVVVNFMQGTGPNNQPLAVSCVGMSKEHAKSLLEILQKTLAEQSPKALPGQANTQKEKTDQSSAKEQ